MEKFAPVVLRVADTVNLPFNEITLTKSSIENALKIGLLIPTSKDWKERLKTVKGNSLVISKVKCLPHTIRISDPADTIPLFDVALSMNFDKMEVRQWRVLDQKGVYVRDYYTTKPNLPFDDTAVLFETNPLATVPNPVALPKDFTLNSFTSNMTVDIQYAMTFLPVFKIRHPQYFNGEILTIVPVDQLFFMEKTNEQ